ncbi:hypothetical protein EST38_g3935 [Candolleomyces aberdarensis]|uniref:Uncharacterized protein n=1 Tax=Candolleomyces aberdarensis TaxID=2316362 RepID=A0A4Q2DSC0_9AGAR|nr:hypothetical protein EST38_g3935 [Candolleomyces aberdarensis]
MDPGTSPLKRKREKEYPRVTFNVGARTFDRLLKEKSLRELKDGVRRKLGYPSYVPLHLAQLRGGKAVDLEDEEDFEAFCSTAYSLSMITVQVTEPEDIPIYAPAKPSPVPHDRNTSPESPKKRKKKRKLGAGDSPTPHDETTTAHGQKRKAPIPDSDREASPSKEPEPLPPKKKKKREVSSNPPKESVLAEDVVAEKTTAVDESAAEKPAEQETEIAAEKEKGKAAEKKKKEKKVKAPEAPAKKAGQSKSKKDKSVPQADADAEPTDNATRDEDVAEKPKKKKKAAKDKTTGEKSAPQGEGSEEPEGDAAAGGTMTKEVKVKKTAKNKNAGRAGNEKDASDKTPAVPQPVVNDKGSDDDEEPDSGKNNQKAPAKATVITGEKAGVAKKTTRGKATAENGQNQNGSSTTGSVGATEKPSEPQAPSKKPSDATVCPICARAPTHTQSRCSIYRGTLAANLKWLEVLKDKQVEDPTNEFRAHQIQLVEGIITKKQNKTGQNGKVVSDVVVGVAASSSTRTAKSAQPDQPEKPEHPRTAPPAPKVPTQPPSNPLKENPQNAHVSQPSTSAKRTAEQREAQPSSGKSSDKPLATKSKHPISLPPDIQQSRKDAKATARGTIPAPQPISTVPVESSSSSGDDTPTPTARKAVPQPPALQKSTVLVESSGPLDKSSDKTSLPKPKTGAEQDSSSSSSSSSSDEDDEDESSNDEIPSRLPPPPGSNVLANPSSIIDADLDAVIRGPNISITSKNLPLSDSGSDEDDEEDKEELVPDSEEEEVRPRRRSNASKAAQISSEEEDSDSGAQESEKSEEAQTTRGGQPPRLSVDTKLPTDESSPSTAVEYGNLSFGAANDLASSVEIDSSGERAFSEAFADDTAVFKLAAAKPDDSGSGEESDHHHQATPPRSNKTKTKSTPNNDRHDPIEPFETPKKPKSPIIQQDLLLSTPRGLTQRMKDRRGKTPTPMSSMEKAMTLHASAAKLLNASRIASKLPTQLQNTQSQKPGPVTSTPAYKPPPRPTRSKANDQSQASDITLNAEETTASANDWEVLQPSDSFGEETMNMEDELQSDPLFIPGETQNAFPFSQWQQPPAVSPNDSDDEDEVENAIAITPRPPTASQKYGYTGLSQFASQRRSYRTSLPAAPRPTDKKDTMAELYGQTGQEASDESGSESDSDSDAEEPEQKSHIPKSRRAGLRSKA